MNSLKGFFSPSIYSHMGTSDSGALPSIIAKEKLILEEYSGQVNVQAFSASVCRKKA